MKLLFENWREYLNEDEFYEVDASDENEEYCPACVEEEKQKACKPTKGKRFAKRVDGKCRSYGQSGKAKDGGDRIRPGTAKADAYCARSAGIKKCKNPPCANTLSRKKWKCQGKRSVEDELQEKTRAAKKGIQLPSAADKLKEYLPENDRHPTHYMQFSDVNKLGINPKSTYNTPLGIYSYPITSLTYRKFARGKLPFAQDRKFVLVFKPREGANIVYSWGDENNGGVSDEDFSKGVIALFSDKAAAIAKSDTMSREFQKYKHGWAMSQEERKKVASDLINAVQDEDEKATRRWEKNPMVRLFVKVIVDKWAAPPYNKFEKYEHAVESFQSMFDLKDPYYGPYVGGIASDFTKADFLKIGAGLAPLAGGLEVAAEKNLEAFQKQEGYVASDDLSVAKATPTYKKMLQNTYKKHNMGHLWWLTRQVSSSDNSKIWRTLLQKVLGIDGVVDVAGEGLIHDAEPIQGVFFSRSAIDQVATIPNTETPDAISRRETAKTTQDIERWFVGYYADIFGGKPRKSQVAGFPNDLIKLWNKNKSELWFAPDEISSFRKFSNWLLGISQEDVLFVSGTQANAEQKRATLKNEIDARVFDLWDITYFNKFKDQLLVKNPKIEVSPKELKQLKDEMADMTFKFYDAVKGGSMNIKDAVEKTKKAHEDILNTLFH